MDGFKDFRKMIEPMLEAFVFPELTSDLGLLKSRALWMYGEFGYVVLKKEGHVPGALDRILNSMKDTNLAIRL